MATLIKIETSELPAGSCIPGDAQSVVNMVGDNLKGSLPDDVTLFNFGPSTPAVERQGQPWIRTDNTGKFLGVYTWTNGAWQAADPQFKTGDIMAFSGSSGSIAAPWYFCNGQIVNGITVPDLQGRFIIGIGQRTLLTGETDTNTTFALNDKGGEEKHKLTTAEMPSHNHPPADGFSNFMSSQNSSGGAQNGTNAGTPTHTGNAGGDTPHNNLPPYYALAFKMYISDADAGI